MTQGQQYRLKIDAYTPETMPLKVMSEYLSDLATLFGEEGCVHLIDVEAGSTCPVVLVDWEAEPKILDRITKARNGEGPQDAVIAIDRINKRLEKDNGSARLLMPNKSELLEFPGVKKSKPIVWPSINQTGTIYGIPVAIGGKSDPVPVHILDGKVEHHLLADRTKAKAIAAHLFTANLKITGRGRWRRLENFTWNLERFIIDDFEPVRLVSMDDTLAELRSIESAWKLLDDPLDALEELRLGEREKVNGRV